MSEIPLEFEYGFAENSLVEIKSSTQKLFLQSPSVDVSGVEYYLQVYPNGDEDGCRGRVFIYFCAAARNAEEIRAKYKLSIASANWHHKIRDYFDRKTPGFGISCCSTDDLFDSTKNFIADGYLTVKVVGTLKVCDHRARISMGAPLNQKAKDFRDLFDVGYKDFVIVSEEKEIWVHKNVLAVQSPVFDAMFKTQMKEQAENRVEVTDFTFEIIQMAVKLCYDQISIADICLDNAISLLQFTDKYDMADIKGNLEIHLGNKINVSNLVNIVNGASTGNSEKLRNQCVDFFADCLSDQSNVPNVDSFDKKFLVDAINNLI